MNLLQTPRMLVMSILMLGLGLACGGILGDDDGCKKDTDCKGSRVCTAGKCTEQMATTGNPPPPKATPYKSPGGIYSFDCFGEDFYMTASSSKLRRYRNEVYARHGYTFKSKDMRRYFKAQPWYTPDPSLTMADVKARFSATDKRCIKRIRQEEKASEEGVACPFVYLVEDGEEILQGEILRHLNTPQKAQWQSLKLYLDGPTKKHIRVRLAEEKAETTMLDAIFLQVGDDEIQPRACSQRQAAFCSADGRHRRLQPGETLDLVFAVPQGHTGPIELWASGHYLPH